MAKKFVVLPKHPEEMTGEELADALDGLADSQVMRSLLLAELAAIRGGAARETRTLRGVWYSLVKPALSRAGLLKKTTRSGRPVPWDAKLSSYLAELVRTDSTAYNEFYIVDGSRQRQTAGRVTRPVASVELVGAHYPWVILFTEKDTIWGEVSGLAALYGVSAISGGGQPSNACTENTVRAIMRSPGYEEEPLVVLSLTDYDPAGYSIAGAQFTQVQETAGRSCEVYHRRLGLEPEQLSPEELERNVYEPKDKGLAEWYEETGGVGGKPLGLELDALPLSRLRGMFAEGIERVIDLEPRRRDLREAYLDLMACELLRPAFDAQRAALLAAVKSNDLWDAIEGAEIPFDLFKQAAVAGWNSIDPLSIDLFDCAEEVRGVMRERLLEAGR